MSRKRNPRERRTEALRLRLTPLEKKLLQDRRKKEGYRNLSEFMRAKIIRKREIKQIIVSPEVSTLIKSMDMNLNKIGVNLNQIAKHMNAENITNLTSADKSLMAKLQQVLKANFSALQKYMDILK
ncbi:plasmid mobilization relaxosome protein MobC [Draconibacterium sp.]|uniref:plasmid mobilization protein n=1 Tax=Draconibacterium sp. TaxID=1965318 RepID=UPI00356B0FB7